VGRRQALIALVLGTFVGTARADELKASVPDGVVGDGRTAVPVVINGSPAGGGKPLPLAEVPVITCNGAPGLAAIGNSALPAVLVPAVTAARTFDCEARLRDSKTTFKLNVRAPAPGLYASTNQVARTTEGSAQLSTFVWDGKRRAVPSWLKAAASDGTVAIGKGGTVTLDVSGKAPRTVAVAMIDGTRVGAAFVPITGSTVLPVESEPGSSVQVWVAGTWYGPVETTGKIAQVPIDVPAGVTQGVARSTDKKGYTSDVVIDLKIPARPRIAVASAAPTIGTGESTLIAVAIAGPDARPANAKTKVVGTAERGTVAIDKAHGGGLWTLRYTAPAGDGQDKITVRVEGDDRAGPGEITMVVRGSAAKIEVDVPTSVKAGTDLSGTIKVIDGAGTVLREPDIGATLDGEPVEVIAGDTLTIAGKIPEQIPADGTLTLEVVSGSIRVRRELAVSGRATTGSSSVVRRAEEPGAIGIGAWASGGYIDNLGAWSSPRASVGAAVRRRFGSVEGAVLVGVEGMSASETVTVDLNGTMEDATRSITGIGVPVAVRARIPLGARLGVAASAVFVPARMRVEFAPASRPVDAYSETVLGVRGQLAGDVVIGPGRAVLGIAFGRGKLSDGVVVGQVDGLGVTLGYEWWFGAFGR
jgi:hypothetical protein